MYRPDLASHDAFASRLPVNKKEQGEPCSWFRKFEKRILAQQSAQIFSSRNDSSAESKLGCTSSTESILVKSSKVRTTEFAPAHLNSAFLSWAHVCRSASSPMPALSIALTPLNSRTSLLPFFRISPTRRDKAAASSRYTILPWQWTIITSPRLRVSRLSFNVDSFGIAATSGAINSPVCQLICVVSMLVDRRSPLHFGTMNIC